MQDTQPWQVCREGQWPHISKPPCPAPCACWSGWYRWPPPPALGVTSGISLDVTNLLCGFGWGLLGCTHSIVGEVFPGGYLSPGECVQTRTRMCLCVQVPYTRTPGFQLSPSPGCSWGTGLWLPGCLSPSSGLTLCPLGTCRLPQPATSSSVWREGVAYQPHVEDRRRRPLRSGPPRHTLPSYSCSV